MIGANGDRRWNWALGAALLLSVGIVFAGGVSLPLAEPDEARYAEIAREMSAAGDWVVPRLQGEVFADKPPLVFWASAAAYALFGVEDWAARLPVLLAALLGLVATWSLARDVYGFETATLAVLILATCPLYFGMSGLLTLDMPLALWTTVGMAAIWRGYRNGSRAAIRLAYVVAALGVLTKGPIAAVLIWMPAAVFLVALRDGATARRMFDPIGVALFLIIALPWFLAMEQRVPGYVSEFLFHHHVERFVNPWHHREPLWFYAPVLFVALFPWSILWLIAAGRRQVSLRFDRPSVPAGFLGLFAGVPVVIFSLSSSKLIPYVLPALPPLAILLAATTVRLVRADEVGFLRGGGWMLVGGGAVSLLVGIVLSVYEFHWRGPLIRPYLVMGGLSLIGLGCAARLAALRNLGRHALLAVVAACLTMVGIAQFARADLARNSRGLGMQARTALGADGSLWAYRKSSPAIDFYARQEARVIEAGEESFIGEFGAGSASDVLLVAAGDAHAVGRLGNFREIGRDQDQVLLVIAR